MDLLEYFRMTEAEGLHAIRQLQREAYSWWERLRWYEKPTVGDDQRLVLRRRLRPAVRLRPRHCCSDDAQFGLSEINWAILPGGGASKVAAELMPFRKAMYHAMMGENLTGKQAAEKGMVNECVPADKLQGARHRKWPTC